MNSSGSQVFKSRVATDQAIRFLRRLVGSWPLEPCCRSMEAGVKFVKCSNCFVIRAERTLFSKDHCLVSWSTHQRFTDGSSTLRTKERWKRSLSFTNTSRRGSNSSQCILTLPLRLIRLRRSRKPLASRNLKSVLRVQKNHPKTYL